MHKYSLGSGEQSEARLTHLNPENPTPSFQGHKFVTNGHFQICHLDVVLHAPHLAVGAARALEDEPQLVYIGLAREQGLACN